MEHNIIFIESFMQKYSLKFKKFPTISWVAMGDDSKCFVSYVTTYVLARSRDP